MNKIKMCSVIFITVGSLMPVYFKVVQKVRFEMTVVYELGNGRK